MSGRISFKALTIGLAMLAAVDLSLLLTPHQQLAEQGPAVDLETLFPKQFGVWQTDENAVQVLVNPQIEKVLLATYRQTLSRTYLDPQGHMIMLSVAYGGSHGEGMQTHRPEVCYPAQGFKLDKEIGMQALPTAYGMLPVKKLVTTLGSRVEPITYWVVVGDISTGFGLQMKLAQMRYNLTGVIPDGMLVRISSIDRDESGAFALHEQYIQALLGALGAPQRLRVTGKLAP